MSCDIAQAFLVSLPVIGMVVMGDNLSTSGVIRTDSSPISLRNGGPWPPTTDALVFGLDAPKRFTRSETHPAGPLRIIYSATDRYPRHLRLFLSDVQNPVGYTEVGLWFVAPEIEWEMEQNPLDDAKIAPGFSDGRVELSELLFAIGGAHVQVERASRLTWEVTLRPLSAADVTSVKELLDEVKAGGPFFFTFDEDDPVGTTRYVFIPEGVTFREMDDTAEPAFVLTLRLAQSLG